MIVTFLKVDGGLQDASGDAREITLEGTVEYNWPSFWHNVESDVKI